MKKEGRISGAQKRPFEDTKQFVREVYDEAYLGEICLDESQIDKDKPYSQIGKKFYQEDFAETVMRKGEEIPLLMMSIDKGPNPKTPSVKRRANAALLYIFADENAQVEPYQTLPEIGGLYGVTKEQIRQDREKYLEKLYEFSLSDIKAKYSLDSLGTRKSFPLAKKIKMSINGNGCVMTVYQLHKQGKSSKEIKEIVGLRPFEGARQRLGAWGLDAPERITRDYSEDIKKIKDPATTIEQLRELIQIFNHPSLLQSYTRRDNPILASISDWQKKAWGNKDKRLTKKAYEILKGNGFPVVAAPLEVNRNGSKVRIGTYLSAFASMEDEGVEILKKNGGAYSNASVTQYVQVEDIAQP